MTDTKNIATKLEEWAAEVTAPSLNTFPENPTDLDQALPLVVCDISRKRRARGEEGFGEVQHQQRTLRLWSARLTVMVTPEPSWTATQALYDFVDELDTALLRDRSLGGRVELASPYTDAEFPGEVEHASGMVALVAFYQVVVGESAEVM